MKRLTLISLILILTACSGGQATKSAATETPPPATQTAEPTATNTPAPTETITPTPTEAPDPTAPLGKYGRDADGVYVIMENGDIARKREFTTATGEILYKDWVVEKTQPGGIKLINFGYSHVIPATLFVDPNVPGSEAILSLTQVNNTAMSNTLTSITSNVGAALNKRPNIANANVSDFFNQLSKGGVTIPIITSSGTDEVGLPITTRSEVRLGPNTGVITIAVPYESLDPAKVPGVSEWMDPIQDQRSYFRSTVRGVDAEGNAIVLIASEKPLNELPIKLIRALLLFGPENIFRQEDQTEPYFNINLSVWVINADQNPGETEPDIIVKLRPMLP
jgi:PBP1b-binding outer membrane lipoprotein LpoB